jgi:hypothetical protein
MSTIKIISYSDNIKIYPVKTDGITADYIQCSPVEATNVSFLDEFPISNDVYNGIIYNTGETFSSNNSISFDVTFLPENVEIYFGELTTDSDATTEDSCIVEGEGFSNIKTFYIRANSSVVGNLTNTVTISCDELITGLIPVQAEIYENAINITPNILNFEQTSLNNDNIKKINILNSSNTQYHLYLTCSNPYLIKDNLGYDIYKEIIVEAYSQIELDIIFNPKAKKTYESLLLIKDQNNKTYYVQLSGVGVISNSRLYDTINQNITTYVEHISPISEEIDKQYIDFDMKMNWNKSTKDISKKIDENSVMQSIKNILLNKRLWYGNNIDLYSLCFENVYAPFYTNRVRETITEKIIDAEPRLSYLDVSFIIAEDQKSISLTIRFSVLSNPQEIFSFPMFIRIR